LQEKKKTEQERGYNSSFLPGCFAQAQRHLGSKLV
jgi:hypothetical protein